MAQVDSENTTVMPIDPTRRHLLTIAAGGAVAAAIAADARAYPGHAADPIYAAIERHKQTAVFWDAAVGVRASFPEGPEPMTDEQWEELDRLDDAVEDARAPLAAARRRSRDDEMDRRLLEHGCRSRCCARQGGAIMTKRTASKIVAGTTARTGADRELPVLVAADVYFQDPEFAGMPLVRMRGDTMSPSLRSGDYAIIDTAHTDVSQGDIFALLDDDGSVIISQVTWVHDGTNVPTGRILCTPRNPRYPPFELPMEDPVKIIGRVAHRVTRHMGEAAPAE